MLHGVELSIRQFTGHRLGVAGVFETQPFDVIYASRGGQTRTLGYVDRTDNAPVMLVRHLKPDLREPVRREVERLRLKGGGCSVSKIIRCPPSPELIKAYLQGDLQKTPKTTVVNWADYADTGSWNE